MFKITYIGVIIYHNNFWGEKHKDYLEFKIFTVKNIICIVYIKLCLILNPNIIVVTILYNVTLYKYIYITRMPRHQDITYLQLLYCISFFNFVF